MTEDLAMTDNTKASGADGAGVLVIWTDVAPAAEADFNAWYDNQHLAERVGVPGFRNGRRYAALEGAPRYLAWYETDTPAVLGSAAYGERQANPTAWTQRIMPSFRNVTRVTAARLAKSGAGLAAAALTLRVRPAPGREATLAEWLIGAPTLFQDAPGFISAQSWRPSDADAARGTTEAELRATEEHPPAWGLVLEATSPEAAQAALQAAGTRALLEKAAGAPVEIGLYRLLLARGVF